MKGFQKSLLVLAMGSLLAAPAMAAEPKPYAKPDDSWISINGTVKSAGADTFLLDYGKGVITVEMDDWDWYREGYKLLDGDNVTVYGRIDDDLFETTKIEADSVYVKSLNSYFYANDADEEDLVFPVTTTVVPTVATTVVQGTVTDIDGRELIVDTGAGKIVVDTINMPYNPLDEQGYQKIEKGDRINAIGAIDNGFFESRELKADAITTLSRDKSKQAS